MKTQAGGRAPYHFNWLNEHLRTPEERRLYAQEIAVLVATQAVVDAMEAAQINRAELVKLIGKSKGFVSQVLSGSRNMTMRTFGDLLWACERQVSGFKTVPLGQSTVPNDFMDCWLDEEPAVQEDVSVSSQKSIDQPLDSELPSWGVA